MAINKGLGGTGSTLTEQIAQTALLTSIDALLTAIDADTSVLAAFDFATETTLSSIDGKITAVNTGDTNITQMVSVVDANNSSTATLGIGATFTGSSTEILNYSSISFFVTSDVDSATDGIQLQFSTDNTNWDEEHLGTLDVSISNSFDVTNLPTHLRYFRVIYTNGGTGQGYMRLQTVLNPSSKSTDPSRYSDNLYLNDIATQTRAVIAGESTAGPGALVNVKVDPAGSISTVANQDTHDSLNANVNLQVGDVDVSTSNKVPVDDSNSMIDSGNSTTTPLGGGATFTGSTIDTSEYDGAIVQIFSDQPSATAGFAFQTSIDGTNWDHGHTYTYVGGSAGRHYTFQLPGQYGRVVFTNSATPQTVFRLSTKLISSAGYSHDHPIDAGLEDQHPAAVTRAILTGKDPTGTYVNVGTSIDAAIKTENIEPPGVRDVFQRTVIANLNNDVDVQFFRDAPEDLVVITAANGGTAVQNAGGALFSSSTNTNGAIKGVTQQRTVYRSGSEIYALFTSTFTAGVASSYQRIGLYDDNDGFFVGYEGTSFGVTVRTGGSDVTVAQASFSIDDLTGSAGSRFTRDGTPEAIDFTKLNVFRIRFGWLGSAPCYWEVMAPDGDWVTFHKTCFPNLQAIPSIENADLPITLDISKTAAGATNLQMQTDCWGAGSTLSERNGLVDESNSRFASLLSAGTSWNNTGVFTDIHRYSLTTILLYSSTNNASGTLYAEFSMDGSTVHRSIQYDVDDAATHPPHTLIPVAQYMRIRYDADPGGGNDHADFTVQTIHHVSKSKPLTSRVTSTINNSTDVDNVRAVIVGENPAAGGTYVNVKVTGSGQIQTDATVSQATHDNLNANANIQIGDTDVSTTNQVPVQGNTAHDAVHVTSNPLDIGGKAVTSTTGPTAVASLDAVRAWWSIYGQMHTINHRHVSGEIDQTALEITYIDSGSTSANGADIDPRDMGYRTGRALIQIASANTPTRIQFIIQTKDDAGNYYNQGSGYWQSLEYEDTAVVGGIRRAFDFKVPETVFRFRVEATGVVSPAEFSISDFKVHMGT